MFVHAYATEPEICNECSLESFTAANNVHCARRGLGMYCPRAVGIRPRRSGCTNNAEMGNILLKAHSINITIPETGSFSSNVSNHYSHFLQVVNDHAPMRSHRLRKRHTIYNEDVATLRRTRDEYHEEAIKTGSAGTWALYRKLRKRITKLTRRSNAAYFKAGIEQAKGDSEKMWTCLRKLFPDLGVFHAWRKMAAS